MCVPEQNTGHMGMGMGIAMISMVFIHLWSDEFAYGFRTHTISNAANIYIYTFQASLANINIMPSFRNVQTACATRK